MALKINTCDATQLGTYTKLESRYEFFPIPDLPSLTQARIEINPELLSQLPEDLQQSLCVNHRSVASYYLPAEQIPNLLANLNPFAKPFHPEPEKVQADLFEGYQKQLAKLRQSSLPSFPVDEENYVLSPLKLFPEDIAFLRSIWHQDGSDSYPEASRWIVTAASRYGKLEQKLDYFSRSIPVGKLQSTLEHLDALIRMDPEHPLPRPIALKECLQNVIKSIKTQPARFTPFFVTPALKEILCKSSTWETCTQVFRDPPKRVSFDELSEKSLAMGHEIWLSVNGRFTQEEVTLLKMFLDDRDNEQLRIVSGSDHAGTFAIVIHRNVDFLKLNKFLSNLYADSSDYQFSSRASDLLLQMKSLADRVKRESFWERARESTINGGGFGIGTAIVAGLGLAARHIYRTFKDSNGPKDPPAGAAGGPPATGSPNRGSSLPHFSKDSMEIALLGGTVLGLTLLTGLLVLSPVDGPAGEIASGMAALERGRRFFQLVATL